MVALEIFSAGRRVKICTPLGTGRRWPSSAEHSSLLVDLCTDFGVNIIGLGLKMTGWLVDIIREEVKMDEAQPTTSPHSFITDSEVWAWLPSQQGQPLPVFFIPSSMLIQ